MGKRIIFIHGRNYKPKKSALQKNWLEAVKHGVGRDFDDATLAAYEAVEKEMAYYGELSNDFLEINGGDQYTDDDKKADLKDRRAALASLKKYQTNEFTKSNYRKIRDFGDVFKESLAGLVSGPASILGFGDKLVSKVAPDMQHYWNSDTKFGSEVRWQLTVPLVSAIENGDDILLVGHSLGTLVCYDVLWKLSHYGEYKKLRESNPRIALMTLGSPLGDGTVQSQLKGGGLKTERKYPQIISRWDNFAAEDDFISHDSTAKDDFSGLRKTGLKPKIKDFKIYNMSLRDGNSNPHHSTGYLIHPKFIKQVVEWLNS